MRGGNGLSLFQRTSDRSINIASWHSPRSLTWRWILNISKPGPVRRGFYWMRSIKGWNTRWFSLCLHTQKAMWLKELEQ